MEIPNLRPNIAHSALLSGEIEYHGLAESGLCPQKLEKGIGEIQISKVVDFQPLIEVRRELALR